MQKCCQLIFDSLFLSSHKIVCVFCSTSIFNTVVIELSVISFSVFNDVCQFELQFDGEGH